jgi:dTDP-4-dehydrorhamnose 3,5-epimerase
VTREAGIEGVRLVPLDAHRDRRGFFAEVFRAEWGVGLAPAQWSVMRSRAGVLRGMHVHPRHTDYGVLVQGRCLVALRDLRPGSPSEGEATAFEVGAEALLGLTIPPGVLHGFYYLAPSLHLLAASHVHDPGDDLGCRWDDPSLGVKWPCEAPRLSRRDAALGPLRALLPRMPAFGDAR